MDRFLLVSLLAWISMINPAFSDDGSGVSNKPQTNNILDQTKQKLNDATQVEEDKIDKGI